jgi:hypothetical protein
MPLPTDGHDSDMSRRCRDSATAILGRDTLIGRSGRQPGIGYTRRGKSAKACSMLPAASVAMTAPRGRPVAAGCYELVRSQRGQPIGVGVSTPSASPAHQGSMAR